MLPETTRTRRRPTTGARLPDLRWEMDRLLRDFFDTGASGNYAAAAPAADLYETENAYVAELELPGFDREDINVTLEQGTLTVTGSRSAEREQEEGEYHLRERSTGRFQRSFRMPESVNVDEVQAHFSNGILEVQMPKAAEARSRKIEVNVD